MDTKEKTKEKRDTHHGHAIKRLRLDRQLSQAQLGQKIGFTQQSISNYEDLPVIEDEILNRFAKGLDVSVDLIKELEEDKPMTYYIENNTFSDYGSIMTGNGSTVNSTVDEKLYKSLLEQVQKLYDTNLKQIENLHATNTRLYQECIVSTQKEINDLKEKLSQLKKK
ncbi:helix-turn-helix domain-containing protein [Parabacteroides pacaensis]|uniref:helix-turn-helix domain-containing protein n=1 Tax=Parabacteroides pacaensis TaxID=2086575 RepID=UPI000D10DB4F|nr:helix-turn-helix transcriptional regulator [Parabacteroides pacaensis]